MKIVATTSLPPVDRPNADRWNAPRSCQLISIGVDISVIGIGMKIGVSIGKVKDPKNWIELGYLYKQDLSQKFSAWKDFEIRFWFLLPGLSMIFKLDWLG